MNPRLSRRQGKLETGRVLGDKRGQAAGVSGSQKLALAYVLRGVAKDAGPRHLCSREGRVLS